MGRKQVSPEHRREVANAYATKWRSENKDRFAEIARECRWRLKVEVINYYGGKCACCGEATMQFLAIDHETGNGKKDRTAKCGANRGGTDFYRKLKQLGFPVGYGVLCHNCNQAKGFYGVCPHASVL